jgi:D-alanyl-D-alanine carboxypeptidase
MIFKLKDLFYGMMLPSGNDAAYQIAQIGGTIINLNR